MPTLHWIGKEKVINHHMDVPFRVLEHKYTFDNGTQTEAPIPVEKARVADSGNEIMHGDIIKTPKALLPKYEERNINQCTQGRSPNILIATNNFQTTPRGVALPS